MVIIVDGEVRLPVEDPEAPSKSEPVAEELMASKEDRDAREAEMTASKAASVELDAEFKVIVALDVTEPDMVELLLADLASAGTSVE